MDTADYGSKVTNLNDFLPSSIKNEFIESLNETIFNRFLTKNDYKRIIGAIGSEDLESSIRNILETSVFDQQNQLQPVASVSLGPNNFFMGWQDFIDKMKSQDVDVDSMDIWGRVKQFNWVPPINLDKFVNYRDYYWDGDINGTLQPDYVTIKNVTHDRKVRFNYFMRSVYDSLAQSVQSYNELGSNVLQLDGNYEGVFTVNEYIIIKLSNYEYDYCTVTNVFFNPLTSKTELSVSKTFNVLTEGVSKTYISAIRDTIDEYTIYVNGNVSELFSVDYIFVAYNNSVATRHILSVASSEYDTISNRTVITINQRLSSQITNIDTSLLLHSIQSETEAFDDGFYNQDLDTYNVAARLAWVSRVNVLESTSATTYLTNTRLTDVNVNFNTSGVQIGDDIDIFSNGSVKLTGTVDSIEDSNNIILANIDQKHLFSSTSTRYIIYRTQKTEDYFVEPNSPIVGQYWIDTSVDTLKIFDGSVWASVYTNFSIIFNNVKNKKIARVENDWSLSNSWVHKTEITTISNKIRARLPIIEFSDKLILSDFAKHEYEWSYRATENDSYRLVPNSPRLIELIDITTTESFTPIIVVDQNTIALAPSLGNLTDSFLEGTTIRLSGFAVNNGIYEVESSEYSQLSVDGAYLTFIRLVEPLNNITDTPVGSSITQETTSFGDDFISHTTHWRYDGVNNIYSTSEVPEKNPMYDIVVSTISDGIRESKIGYNWQSFTPVAGDELNPTFLLHGSLHKLCLYDDYQEGDIRVYVNGIRQYANFIETPSYIDDRFVGAIQFVDNVTISTHDVVLIELGEYATSDAGWRALTVNTPSGFETVNLSRYKRVEQQKINQNQYPEFCLINAKTSEREHETSKIFSYIEDGSAPLNPYVYKKLALDAKNGSFLFEQHLVGDNNEIKSYLERSINSTVIPKTIWKLGNNSEEYLPYKNSEGDWNISNNWFYNIQHENNKVNSFINLFSHFRSIVEAQSQPGISNSDTNVYFLHDNVNYGLGGTIKDHNGNMDLLVSAMMANNVTVEQLIKFAENQYAAATNYIIDDYYTRIAQLLTLPSNDYTSLLQNVTNDLINVFENNEKYSYWYGDSSFYDNGIGVRNWIISLAKIGLVKPVVPYTIVDENLSIYQLIHHDGHRSNVVISPAEREQLFATLIGSANHTQDIVTSDLQPFPVVINSIPVVNGDFLLRTNTVARTRKLFRYSAIGTWEEINLNLLLLDVLLGIEKRLYASCKDNELFYDITAIKANQKYDEKASAQFYKYAASLNILSPLSNSDRYSSNNQFTWNYFYSTVDAAPSNIIGAPAADWRQLYKNWFGTAYPHLEPWILQGYLNKPEWWDAYYLDITTKMHTVSMWDNIFDGIVPSGYLLPDGTESTGVTGEITNVFSYLPVVTDTNDTSDGYEYGQLLPPYWNSANTTNQRIRSLFDPNSGDEIIYPNADFAYGQVGDIEYQWTESISFLYDHALISFKLDPLNFFSIAFNPDKYSVDCLQLHSHSSNIESSKYTTFHGDSLGEGKHFICNGLNQWYVNFNRYEGYDKVSADFYSIWNGWTPKLSYIFDSVIDVESFNISSNAFDITQKDYSLNLKIDKNVTIRNLDSLNLSLLSVPSTYLGDTAQGWNVEISTIPTEKRPIVYYLPQNYPVGVYNSDTFMVSSYSVRDIDYVAAKMKQHVSYNNSLQLSSTTSLNNDGTLYTATVTINSTPYSVEIAGEDAQTVSTLISAINEQIDTAFFDLVNGDIYLISEDVGISTTLDIQDTDLFSSIPNFAAIEPSAPSTNIFGNIIMVSGNITNKLKADDTVTILNSTILNGQYTVLSSTYDMVNNLTILNVKEFVDLPEYDEPIIDGILRIDSELGLHDSWITGTEIYFNTNSAVSGIDTEIPYYIIKVDDYTFKIAKSLYNAEHGTAMDISGVQISGDLYAGKLLRTFTVYSGISNINWRVHDIDRRTQLSVYDGNSLSGMQSIIDFLVGFAAYATDQGFNIKTGIIDNETGLQTSWEYYIEKFIDWAFSIRAMSQTNYPVYKVEADSDVNGFNFLDSSVPNWGSGTTVILKEDSGSSLPAPFVSSLLVNVPYYVIRTLSNNYIQLAATAYDASIGNAIKFNQNSTGSVYMQVYEKLQNVYTFNFNPFKTQLTLIHDTGILDNVFGGNNFVYDTNNNLMTNSQLFVSRRDKKTDITLLGYIQEYNVNNPLTAISIGGASLSLSEYKHIISFENYSVVGDLIYDPFLGMRTPRFFVEFNRQQNITARPTLGGYTLYNDTFIQNIESSIEDSRYFYDAIKAIENKKTTTAVRKALGYDGPKKYMTDIGMDQKTQFLFWKAMIQNKGTNFAVNAFTNQKNLKDALVDEHWAYKVTTFGGANKKEYMEMKLLAQDAVRNELRLEFIPPNNTVMNSTFEGVELTDTKRWYQQPDQLESWAPYDTFFFDVKVTNIMNIESADIMNVRGDNVIRLIDKADGVIISYFDEVTETTKLLIEETDYVKINAELIKFLPSIDPFNLNKLTVSLLMYNYDTQNPSKIIDRKSSVSISDVPFWHPAIGQHYLKAYAAIDFKTSSDPATYIVSPDNTQTTSVNVWMGDMVGKVWLDDKNEGYMPYYDNKLMPNINDRIFNWGKMADWANIDIYQWTSSTLSPSEWELTAKKQLNDYTIPDELKVTGNPLKYLYRNINFGTSPTPQWVRDDDIHYEFISGLLTEDNVEEILGDVEVYVNGDYKYNMTVTDKLQYVSITNNMAVGNYVHIIKRRHAPTETEINLQKYKFDTPYSIEYRTDKVTGNRYPIYYYWVSNKTNKIINKSTEYTLIGVKTQLITNPEPFMILQNLRPDGAGYGLVYGNIYDEFAYNLPYRYTQLVIKGLEGRIKDDNRYTLRFIKDFNLRDNLNETDLKLKNVHTEWKLFRKRQSNKIDRLLWNKLIESIMKFKMLSDVTYDPNVSLPSLNRIVYDNIYQSDTSYGLGDEQVLIESELAKKIIMHNLADPDNTFTMVNMNEFITTVDFSTAEKTIDTMNRIYTLFTAEEVNRLFFDILHDVMASKKEHKDFFKTSWVTIQISQDVDINNNISTFTEHNLIEGEPCSEPDAIIEATPTPSPSPTPTPTPSPSPTPTSSITESVTPTPTPSITESVTPTPTPSPSAIIPSVFLNHFEQYSNLTDAPGALVSLDFNGSDGATTTTDDGSLARTWTFTGTAEIDTAQSVEGSASLWAANGGYISTDNNDGAFNFGSGDWCIEGSYRIPSGGSTGISRRIDNGFCPFSIEIGLSSWYINIANADINNWAISQVFFPSSTPDTWYDFIVESYNGVIRAFRNRVQVNPDITAAPVPSSSAPLYVGRYAAWNAATQAGHLDRVRVYNYAPYLGNPNIIKSTIGPDIIASNGAGLGGVPKFGAGAGLLVNSAGWQMVASGITGVAFNDTWRIEAWVRGTTALGVFKVRTANDSHYLSLASPSNSGSEAIQYAVGSSGGSGSGVAGSVGDAITIDGVTYNHVALQHEGGTSRTSWYINGNRVLLSDILGGDWSVTFAGTNIEVIEVGSANPGGHSIDEVVLRKDMELWGATYDVPTVPYQP